MTIFNWTKYELISMFIEVFFKRIIGNNILSIFLRNSAIEHSEEKGIFAVDPPTISETTVK